MRRSKHSEFWQVAVRNIRRFPGRAVAVFVPLFAVMALASAMTFLKDGINQDALESIKPLADITVSQVQAGKPVFISAETAGDISQYANVEKTTARIWGTVRSPASQGADVFTLIGVDLSRVAAEKDISLAIESGRFLGAQDRNSIVVGKIFASRNRVNPGDAIMLADDNGDWSSFTVVGIFASPVQIYTADLIVTDLETAGKFFNYPPGNYSDLGVYLKEPAYAGQVSGAIRAAYPDLKAVTRETLASGIRQGYASRLGVFQLMWQILLLTALLAAWAQSSSISLEMRKEIGVLKTIGWQTLDIIELKMMEILIIGLSALFAGMILGIFYLYAGAPLLKEYFLGWSRAYPAFPIPVYIEWSSLFLLFVIGIFPLCAATVASAWRMGTIEPDNAIRSG